MSDSSSQPLVSCVMPTTARRRLFIPQAINYFQRQDYVNKELLIVDDGPESIADLIPANPSVRYIRLAGQRSLGAKRNECVKAAAGDLIMHWDDDDWMAPHRISHQVEALHHERAMVCGLQRMLFYDFTTGAVWLYEYPNNQRPWLAGGSLLYTREFWSRSPFPDIQVGSDTRFVLSQKLERFTVLSDYSFYVAMIHPDNTSPKNCRGSYWSPWNGSVLKIMAADYRFYETLLTNKKMNETDTAFESSTTVSQCRQPELANAGVVSEELKQGPERTLPQTATALRVAQRTSPLVKRNGQRPRVSCILATGNRPAFARQAIRYFLRQTLAEAELIVVDDGEQSLAELCAGLFRVRHVRLEEPTLLGRKLNIGIEHSRGAIIQKLDDDDFYHQDFLARAVETLEQARDERAVVTWDCFTILLAGEKQARYSGHGWTTGATLCFHRKLWERCGFREEPSRVDAWFLEDHSPQLIKVCAPELIMVVRHGSNTWQQLSNGASVDRHFQSLPMHKKSLDDLVEPLDRHFYHCLLKETAQ